MVKVYLASALLDRLGGEGAALPQPFEVAATDLRGALEALFAARPGLRGYVLDEHGVVRRHVALFVDGRSIRDKTRLDQPLSRDGEVHVMQALSGG